MTGRDRIVLMVIVVAGRRSPAAGCCSSRRAQGSEDGRRTGDLRAARARERRKPARRTREAAQAQYAAAYAAVVNLGKAVPAEPGSASLIYQLEEASNLRDVGFNSIVSGRRRAASGLEPRSGSLRAARRPARRQRRHPGFTADAVHLRLQRQLLLARTPLPPAHRLHDPPRARTGCRVSGRLLTIQSVKLAPEVRRHRPQPEADGHGHRDRLRAARRPGPDRRRDSRLADRRRDARRRWLRRAPRPRRRSRG